MVSWAIVVLMLTLVVRVGRTTLLVRHRTKGTTAVRATALLPQTPGNTRTTAGAHAPPCIIDVPSACSCESAPTPAGSAAGSHCGTRRDGTASARPFRTPWSTVPSRTTASSCTRERCHIGYQSIRPCTRIERASETTPVPKQPQDIKVNVETFLQRQGRGGTVYGRGVVRVVRKQDGAIPCTVRARRTPGCTQASYQRLLMRPTRS